jgi:PAS domain S-box-containing protein
MSRTVKTAGFISGRLVRLSPVVRYGIAVVAAEAAILLRFALDPIWDVKLPFSFFYPAVMISAWVGGLGPGIIATILSAVAADFFWLKPIGSLSIGDPADAAGLLVFVAIGIVMSALNETWRYAAVRIGESEERHRVTLTSIADAVITTNESGIVTHLNSVAEDLTGWKEKDAIGRHVDRVFIVMDENTQRRIRNPVEGVLKDGITCALPSSTLLVSKDGRNIPIDNRAAPIKLKNGRTVGVVMVFRDVTVRRVVDRERTALTERERKARQEAEDANRGRDEFLAMLSHELRTPLSSILGWTTILKSKDLPEQKASHALEVIERNARMEAALVETLLDLSRISAGKLKLTMEPLEIASVVMATLDSLRPTADAKGVRLEVQLLPVSIRISGDSARLQQIFSNLLSNAIKFTARDGHVRVQMTRHESKVDIQIIDDGEGITPEFLPHIFDRFRQADSATGRAYGGLGLGLAIVRELVNAHGGTIVANSAGRGQGSTFCVTLPTIAIAERELDAVAAPSRGTEELSIARLRILIVDDDMDARELIRLTLESRGARVTQASSARDALEAIYREEPEVLLADIGMPQEDGYSLVAKLRSLEQEQNRSRLPAIALTAYASEADREHALSAGFDLHLTKPVQPRELIRAIATTFHRQTERGINFRHKDRTA